MTIDHASVTVSKDKYESVVAFYEKALAPLGYKKSIEFPFVTGMADANGAKDFWITGMDISGEVLTHIAFKSPDRETVDKFHEAALAAGAKDNGKPGVRAHYHPNYYGAFVISPCGNNIEAVCHYPN